MAHIQVFGTGLYVSIGTITPEVASLLCQPTLTRADLLEILDDLDTDMRSGLDGEGTVEVDGVVQSVSIPDPSSLPLEGGTEKFGKSGEYSFLTVETANGYWFDVEAPGDFDPTKLAVQVTEYVLPDDGRIRISDLSYQGLEESLGYDGLVETRGETICKLIFYYVISPDGDSREVVTVD